MCQPTSSSPTEHVQNRPPALHVRSEYARDVHRDELPQIPEGGKCNFNHLFYIYLFIHFIMLSGDVPLVVFVIILTVCLFLCCPSVIKASTASLDGCTSKGQPWLLMTLVQLKPLHPFCVWVCQLTLKLSSLSLLYFQSQVKLPKCIASSHMVQGLKFSSYF